MRDDLQVPNLGNPPDVYDSRAFYRIIRSIELHLQALQNVGPVRVSRINIVNLPTDDTGLRVGDLWNDGGTIKIVE